MIGRLMLLAVGFGILAGVAHVAGVLPFRQNTAPTAAAETNLGKDARSIDALVPAVSVAPATAARFVDSVLVTGSLVARDEVLIVPEVEGLRIVALGVEEGDSVASGQQLARLEQETLDAQLAQNEASLARASAAIAQAQSQIAQAEARLTEANANFERAQPLRKTGAVSEAVYDQREAAARTAAAQLTAAQDGLKLAGAERAVIEAQRREITWRRSRTDIKAPLDGLVSRRTARVGSMATAAGEPMFRLAAKGEIELDAEVPEVDMGRLKQGQPARIAVPGAGEVEGRVRLVSPEVDKVTRLGKVRVFLGADPRLRIGSFGRGIVEVARSKGLSIPASAVLYGADGAHVLVVKGDVVENRRVNVGLASSDMVEIASGLAEGELVVAKAGTFLRDGDRIRPVRASTSSEKISEAD